MASRIANTRQTSRMSIMSTLARYDPARSTSSPRPDGSSVFLPERFLLSRWGARHDHGLREGREPINDLVRIRTSLGACACEPLLFRLLLALGPFIHGGGHAPEVGRRSTR